MTTIEILKGAKSVVKDIALLDTETKNKALLFLADALLENANDILAANAIDVEKARATVSEVMLDRLTLTMPRIEAMADGIRQVVALDDPVGETISEYVRNGMTIKKVSAPLGVVAIIYEIGRAHV